MGNNTQFKQILIDVDNYNALKDLGKAGDSFNDVLTSLIGANTNGCQADACYTADNIVYAPSSKIFMLRINSTLRKLGVISITCHKDHLTISCRGDEGIDVYYPENMDNLQDSIESELRLKTELCESNIRTIGWYISENTEQIKSVLTQIK